MSKSQRTKGAAYERELTTEANETLGHLDGFNCSRRLNQSRDAGHDFDLLCFNVEAKRRARSLPAEKWLAQAEASCVSMYARKMPLVVTRGDNGKSLAVFKWSHLLKILRFLYDLIEVFAMMVEDTSPRMFTEETAERIEAILPRLRAMR